MTYITDSWILTYKCTYLLSMFIFSAPFPGHTNAVIVTPTPLKADVVSNAGVVIAPSHLGGVCLQLCSYTAVA